MRDLTVDTSFHIWYSPEDSKTKKRQPPIRVDCGSMIGWWPVYRPYVELKLTKFTGSKNNDYYIGDATGNPLLEAK